MKNTSQHTWSSASLYSLGAQAPQDNSAWGSARIPLPHDVGPGETVTFDFQVHAPACDGFYNFQWRMVQDWVAWFGDYTPLVIVEVGVIPKDSDKVHPTRKELRDGTLVMHHHQVPAGVIARGYSGRTDVASKGINTFIEIGPRPGESEPTS